MKTITNTTLKQILVSFTATVFLYSFVPFTSAETETTNTPHDGTYVPGEIIVQYEDTVTIAQIQRDETEDGPSSASEEASDRPVSTIESGDEEGGVLCIWECVV